jgi:hypothetical protein
MRLVLSNWYYRLVCFAADVLWRSAELALQALGHVDRRLKRVRTWTFLAESAAVNVTNQTNPLGRLHFCHVALRFLIATAAQMFVT